MPFIRTSTNIKIEKEKLDQIKTRYGEAIHIMGKPESFLMLEFSDESKMYFKGEDANPIAFIDIKILGNLQNADEMTKELTKIISEELSILPSNIYISYQSYQTWGYNGSNF